MTENILITGGFGCIGAETAKWIARHSENHVVVLSRSVDEQRVERVFHDVDRSRFSFVASDVTNHDDLTRVLDQHEISQVVHLAALQTPDCNADRDLGLQINLAGTQKLFEAMKATRNTMRRMVYASSVAVYGPRKSYPQSRVPMLAAPDPVNVYGVWKLAGEHLSRLFHAETEIPTICLRPGVLFGPGRDAGLTSTPTTAIKSVALGVPYTIPFCSRQDYQYAPDVGAAFAIASHDPFEGFGIYTLPGHTADTHEFVATIRTASQRLGIGDRCRVSVGNETVPFICDLEYKPFLDAFPNAPRTPLARSVEESLEVFCDQASRGWLSGKEE